MDHNLDDAVLPTEKTDTDQSAKNEITKDQNKNQQIWDLSSSETASTRLQSVVSDITLLSVYPLTSSITPFLQPSGSATHFLRPAVFAAEPLTSSPSSRCRAVNFTADIFFYADPWAQHLYLSHPPHFQSKWGSFVGKISLHFKNPLKLSKI